MFHNKLRPHIGILFHNTWVLYFKASCGGRDDGGHNVAESVLIMDVDPEPPMICERTKPKFEVTTNNDINGW
jgi:hypothetical protein